MVTRIFKNMMFEGTWSELEAKKRGAVAVPGVVYAYKKYTKITRANVIKNR